MKTKRVIKLVVVLTLAMAALTACGTNNTDNNAGISGEEITVISREANSGTRGAFDELMNIVIEENGNTVDKLYEEAVLVDSTDAVASKVEVDECAIGYTSLGSVNEYVKAVSVDGVEATAENVKNGSYKISRPFVFAVTGNASDVAKDFIKFVTSKEGQAIVEEKGYISVGSAESYVASGISGKVTLSGSTSVEKVVEKLKEEYIKLNPDVNVEITYSGSSSGIKDVTADKVDIGMSSRALKDSEKEFLTETVFAHDGIAVIVNKANPVDGLTSDEINEIFTGVKREW